MKYTIGMMNCEIDVTISDIKDLQTYIEDSRVYYILDEEGNEVYFDKVGMITDILEKPECRAIQRKESAEVMQLDGKSSKGCKPLRKIELMEV